MTPLAELELTRSEGDRRLYVLAGVGTLRREGLFARSAIAEAGSEQWRFARVGLWGRTIQAVDSSGAAVGEFNRREWRGGGGIEWAGRAYALRPISFIRTRYALADDNGELAHIDAKGWGKRPVAVTVLTAVDPGLLLFAAYVSDALAEDASSAAGGASAAATGG